MFFELLQLLLRLLISISRKGIPKKVILFAMKDFLKTTGKF